MTVLRTLIVGAGRAGQALARDLDQPKTPGGRGGQDDQELRPIGFVDDAAARVSARTPAESPTTASGETAQRLSHLGALPDLPRLITEHRADAVILAIPSLPPARTRELTAAAVGAGAVVRYLPWHTASLSRDAAAEDLLPLDIRALIGGPAPYQVSSEVKEIVTGKRLLVAGATGALGAEFCRQLNGFHPDELRVLDRTVIADRDRTDHAFRDFRPEVVFHAPDVVRQQLLKLAESRG